MAQGGQGRSLMERRRAGGRGRQSSWRRQAMGVPSWEAMGPWEFPHGEKSRRWRHRRSCCEGGGWQTTVFCSRIFCTGRLAERESGRQAFSWYHNLLFFKQTTVILSFSLLGRRKSKEEKEVSVWGSGPKWSVYSQFGPNISMMNPPHSKCTVPLWSR